MRRFLGLWGGVRIAVAILVWALVSSCDDSRTDSPAGGGGGGGGGGGSSDTSGGGSDGSGGGDSGGEGSEGSGEEGGIPTGENPTPGCYGTEGQTEVDLQGLELAPFPNGLLPGEVCDTDSDCMYGLCTSDTLITQGKFKICVKKCGGCGDKSPACNWDDDSETGLAFTCVKAKFGGEDQSHCAVQCSDVGECESFSPDYTTCNTENAARKYCGSRD